jgi:hypothetical protein
LWHRRFKIASLIFTALVLLTGLWETRESKLLGTHVEARCSIVMRVDDQDVFLLEKSGEGQLRDSPEVRQG